MKAQFELHAPEIDWATRQKSCYEVRINAGSQQMQIPIWISIEHPGEPALLLLGGQHGDEYQGPAILSLFLSESWKDLRGNIVIIPSTNPPAYQAGLRCSPLDGVNLNRSFPGSSDGTLTGAIAYFLSQQILPNINFVLDIHSGGNGLDSIPSIMTHHLASEDLQRKTFAAIHASEIPLCVVVDESHKPGMFDTYAEDREIVFLCAEIGGGHLRSSDLEYGLRMVRRITASVAFEMRDAFPPQPAGSSTRLLEVGSTEQYVMSEQDGLFCPLVAPGDHVAAGEQFGVFFPQDDEPDAKHVCRSPRDGMVYMIRVSGLTRTGEELVILAREANVRLAKLWEQAGSPCNAPQQT